MPVVQRQDGHGRVNALVCEWKLLGATEDSRDAMRGPLSDHHRRGFDGDEVPVEGLVRSGTRSDVHDRLSIAQRRP